MGEGWDSWFPIYVNEYAGVFWASAPEFEDIGFFDSRSDAVSAAEMMDFGDARISLDPDKEEDEDTNDESGQMQSAAQAGPLEPSDLVAEPTIESEDPAPRTTDDDLYDTVTQPQASQPPEDTYLERIRTYGWPLTKASYVRAMFGLVDTLKFPLDLQIQAQIPEDLPGEMPREIMDLCQEPLVERQLFNWAYVRAALEEWKRPPEVMQNQLSQTELEAIRKLAESGEKPAGHMWGHDQKQFRAAVAGLLDAGVRSLGSDLAVQIVRGQVSVYTGPEPKRTVAQARHDYSPQANPCPRCHALPLQLTWRYLSILSQVAPTGRAGWLTTCEACVLQVDFFQERSWFS